MKVSKRDAKLLLVLTGLLVFLGLYSLVYNPTVEKTEAVNARIAQLRPEVQALEAHYQKLSVYETGIAQSRTIVDNGMKALPKDVKEEDTLSYLLGMEKNKGYFMESVTFQDPTLFSQFDATMHINGQDVVETVSAYRHTTVMTGEMTYEQAKSVMDYLYATSKQTVLDSVGLTYDTATGELETSFQLSKFSLDWPGGVYVPEVVPSATFGVPNLFGVQTENNQPNQG